MRSIFHALLLCLSLLCHIQGTQGFLPPPPDKRSYSIRAEGQHKAKISSPFENRFDYEDNFVSKIWIFLFSRKMAEAGGLPVPNSFVTYQDFVQLSRELLKGPPEKVKQTVLTVLKTIAFPGFSSIFRAFFPGKSRSACEFNAAITPVFFSWLVGPAKVEKRELVTQSGETKVWSSTVKIECCRYLQTSACKGACINVCKLPTQEFFTKELGMPVTMQPNFEDLSCLMTFGQMPTPLSQDPISKERCFKECLSAKPSLPMCPKIPKEKELRLDKGKGILSK